MHIFHMYLYIHFYISKIKVNWHCHPAYNCKISSQFETKGKIIFWQNNHQGRISADWNTSRKSKFTWQIHSSFSKIALHLLVYDERNQESCGKTGPFSFLEELPCRTGCLVWPTIDSKIQNTYENSSTCHTCKISHTCVPVCTLKIHVTVTQE